MRKRVKPSAMRREGSRMKNGLLDLIKYIKDNSDKPLTEMTMVEIGSYQGESISLFAEAGFEKLYAVDPWQDEGETTTVGCPYVYVEAAFDKVNESFDQITKVKGFSVDIAENFEDNSLDFVYIDALHTYEALMSDISAWHPKIKSGGWIGGHDSTGYWGKFLRPAIQENFGKKTYTIFDDTSWLIKANQRIKS